MKDIILFTRVPKEGTTKTRLYDFLTPKMAVKLQENLLVDLYNKLIKWGFNVKVFHSGSSEDDFYMKNLLGISNFYYQQGQNLGDKMYNAISSFFENKEERKILLMGSDVVGITKEIIDYAFSSLENNDVVLNPTYDGGYYLVGVKKTIKEIFNIDKYGDNNVFEKTINILEQKKLTYKIGKKCLDIDTKEDLLTYATGFKNIKLLGAGEYNINFLYDYTASEKRVLRINLKSQMNLEKQIDYEFSTLKLLEASKVTPKVYEKKEKNNILPYDYLTMEFLEGRPLCYDKDMKIASYLLSSIHNTKFSLKDNKLIMPTNPFLMMYEECFSMANHYLKWNEADEKVKKYLLKFLNICSELLDDNYKASDICIINTELNSKNFIIGNTFFDSYVIDWEKAIIGECEQDLAHFLAPTTTFWKTEKILTKKEINDFLEDYKKYRIYDKNKFKKYFIFTCLRGITWCSMAYKEYVLKEKMLCDDYTFKKIKSYLSYDFLELLDNYFLNK